MKEKKFQEKFGQWLKYRYKKIGVFELKVVQKGHSLLRSHVKDHQIQALRLSTGVGLYHKLPDVGIAQKPWDCFNLVDVPAYIVVMYYDRGVKDFYMIHIDEINDKTFPIKEEQAGIIGAKYTLGV